MSKFQWSNKEKKKGLFGISFVLVTLAVAACFVDAAFSKGSQLMNKKEPSNQVQETEETEDDDFEVIVGDDVPTLNIDDSLPLLTNEEELNLKEKLWSLYQQAEIKTAAELILEEYKTHQFSEENELYDWYVDLSYLNVLNNVEDRTKALSNLHIPRLLVMNLVQEPLILNVASSIEDAESLVPYAAQNVLFVEERVIEDVDGWEAPSVHANLLKDSLSRIWEIDLFIDGEEVTGVVGRFEAIQQNRIIGFYSDNESTNFLTDGFIEEHRSSVENTPIMK